MEILFYQPSHSVSSLVERYEILRSGEFLESVSDKHIPNGYASFVFNFSGTVHILSKQKIIAPPFFLTFPVLKSVTIEASGMLDSFVVICKASVLSKLFNINMKPDSNPFFKEPDPKIFGPLWESLQEIHDPRLKIEVFESFILKNILVKTYQPDETDRIYFNIIEFAAKKPINEIITESLFSASTFRRNFIKRVGINAKSLARIVRVNTLWDMIRKNNATDFQNILFDCNYFDQSHFIRDFKMFIGERPNHFFKRNLDLVSFISGKG